jgi:hypothetical protein
MSKALLTRPIIANLAETINVKLTAWWQLGIFVTTTTVTIGSGKTYRTNEEKLAVLKNCKTRNV